jgi:hypothetical protein
MRGFSVTLQAMRYKRGIILKWNLKIWFEDVKWIYLAEDNVQWQAFVNTEMIIQKP